MYMKGQIIGIWVLSAIVIGCGPKQLDSSEVKRLLEEAKVYPAVVALTLFCNDTDTAILVDEKGLTGLGLVTAQFAHTHSDMGQPLIHFTDAAEQYLLPTSDTLKSFDEQKVRVAEERFNEVTEIRYSEDGRNALVTYTTIMINITPFAVMYPQSLEGEHGRQAFFTLTDNGWQWDKKVKKLSPAK